MIFNVIMSKGLEPTKYDSPCKLKRYDTEVAMSIADEKLLYK